MNTIQTSNDTRRYMPQLDGLRALAVCAVLLHHYSDKADFGRVNLAALGVWLFFVLSGFLITRILLHSRDDVVYHRCPSGFALRQFYIRRFLRIFPLYYFTLAVAAWLDLGQVRETVFWHLAYLSNYLFATHGEWGIVTAHFWSLAVEEQFYILWPAIILFTPARALLKVIIAVIAVGPIFRLVGYFLSFNGIALYATTPASLDSLGVGALLAYCSHHAAERPQWIGRLNLCTRWLGIPGVIGFIVLWTLESFKLLPPVTDYIWFTEPTLWALVFAGVINRASFGYSGISGKILQLKPLLYLGKISYGIYVYHLFMLSLVPLVLARIGINFSFLLGWVQFVMLTGVTVGLAAISWHSFELPLNSLKNYFNYAGKSASRNPSGLALSSSS
jgi:peptidoglycan/LPS O-acetylase OafA/YrhL